MVAAEGGCVIGKQIFFYGPSPLKNISIKGLVLTNEQKDKLYLPHAQL